MSIKRITISLMLCVMLVLSSITCSEAAPGNPAGHSPPAAGNRLKEQKKPDWEELKAFMEKWLKEKGFPPWFCWWGWFYWLPWWSINDPNNDIPAWEDFPYYFYDEMDDYNLYFGQLNAHTNLSDGKGSLGEAYRHARDVAGLDFFAVTDDSRMFDNAARATLSDGSASSEWTRGKAIAESYTNSSFVAIFGYEMAWDNGNGHISTFNTEGFETPDEPAYKGSKGLAAYYNALKKHPASISQLNHPGKKHGDFHDFAYYDEEIDAVVSLIEVGNGEGAVGSSKYYRSYDYYTRALDKGWHLAPTNNQDNRSGNFGTANTARTVVLARKLTREDLYDAMRNRRVYATEDENLKIWYTLNGRIMGSIVKTASNQVRIRVKLEESDGETIGKVSVITEGGEIVTSQTLAVQSYTLELTLPADRPYYYIRVDQFDKDIAITAPVWVEKVTYTWQKDEGKKDDAVKKVRDLIEKIYTKDFRISEEALKKAREAYNKLREDQKKQVDNYYKLFYAERWQEWKEYLSKIGIKPDPKPARGKK